MAAIGIIANPMSGKDIRRLVSHATAIDNNEKVNIMERVVTGAQAVGVNRIVMMPEKHNMAYRAIDDLIKGNELHIDVEVLDYHIFDMVIDTEEAAKRMEADPGVGCIVSLGGDGTNRAIAKHIRETPLLSISTGTNNVYPEWVEGTVAGMAAGFIACRHFDIDDFLVRQKRIEIYINRAFRDIALVDVVLSDDPVIGSKAIWKTDHIQAVAVSRSHPGTIGFSAIAGVREIIRKEEPRGGIIYLGDEYPQLLAPVAPGIIERIGVSEMETIPLDQPYPLRIQKRGTLALDGEREIYVKPEDRVDLLLTCKGPKQVLVRETLERAFEGGCYMADRICPKS